MLDEADVQIERVTVDLRAIRAQRGRVTGEIADRLIVSMFIATFLTLSDWYGIERWYWIKRRSQRVGGPPARLRAAAWLLLSRRDTRRIGTPIVELFVSLGFRVVVPLEQQ
jgi:hypothetical protein